MTENTSKHKRIGRLVGALFALLCGGAAVVLWLHDVVLRSLGLVLCVGGVYLIKASNVGGVKDVLAARTGRTRADEPPNRPDPFTWVLGGIALGATVFTFYALYRSARGGHYDVHAAYAFTAAVVVCALTWVYIVSKLR